MKYDKVFEDFYSRKSSVSKCKMRNVSTDIGMDAYSYKRKLRGALLRYQNKFFNDCLKITWLMRRFTYLGKLRDKRGGLNGVWMDRAFGSFMYHRVGIEYKLLTYNRLYTAIVSYINDFFPDFNEVDPFKRGFTYKIPYKHITVEYLFFVYKIPERLELLQYAEENRLSYVKFMDYVLNHVYCRNEEMGYEPHNGAFVLINNNTFAHYVNYIEKKDLSKK